MPSSYSVGQFADELGVHTETVKRWCRQGDVDFSRTPGGDRRIPERERRRLAGDTRPSDCVALYARARTNDPTAGSVDDQLERLREHAEAHEWEIEESYRDAADAADSGATNAAVSGATDAADRDAGDAADRHDAGDDRPGLNALLDDVPEADYGRVLVVHEALLADAGRSFLERHLDYLDVAITPLEDVPQTVEASDAGDETIEAGEVAETTAVSDDAETTDTTDANETTEATDVDETIVTSEAANPTAPGPDADTPAAPASPYHVDARRLAERERASERLTESLRATLRSYADGDFDATVDVDPDELALDPSLRSLADHVDRLGTDLADAVEDAATEPDAGTTADAEAESNAATTSDAGAESGHAAELERYRTLARRLGSATDEASRSIDDVAAATDEIETQATEQVDLAVAASGDVVDVADALAAVDDAASDAEVHGERARELTADGRDAVTEAVEVLEDAVDATETTTDHLLTLRSRVEDVDEVAAAIDDVADETHVLALNAQIEAARAGADAAGFGVVAQEVKALAADARESAQEIEAIVQDVRGETDLTAQELETARQQVVEGRDAVAEVEGVLPDVTDAIATISEDLGAATEAVATGEDAVEGTRSTVTDLRSSAEDHVETVEELSVRADETASAIDGVDDIGERLDSKRDRLRSNAD